MVKELRESFKLVHYVLVTATDVKTASNVVLLQFEKPADQSAAAKERRAGYGQIYYNRYAKGDTMTEQEARAKVVSIAQSYIGCKESDGSHRKIIDLSLTHIEEALMWLNRRTEDRAERNVLGTTEK